MTRKLAATFWGLIALLVPLTLLRVLHAPTWAYFPAGIISGIFALITYFIVEGPSQ